jgi:hypothetical protein
MKKSLIFAAVCWASSVHASPASQRPIDVPMAFRASANVYALVGVGTATTNDCTVTAEGMAARVEGERGHAWLVFLDDSGEEEGTCELRSLVVEAPVATAAKVSLPRAKALIKVAVLK